jgi:hypothetical protein
MSPPVTVPFARLPTLGCSPAKSTAAHIRHALLHSTLRYAGSSTSGSGGALDDSLDADADAATASF